MNVWDDKAERRLAEMSDIDEEIINDLDIKRNL